MPGVAVAVVPVDPLSEGGVVIYIAMNGYRSRKA